LVLRSSRIHFHLQVRPEDEGSFSETLARVYQSTRLHFPGDRDLEVCLILLCPDEVNFILSTLGFSNTIYGTSCFVTQQIPTCRKCGTGEETSVHILCECETLASLRYTHLGSLFLDPEDVRKLGMGAIWNCAKGTRLL